MQENSNSRYFQENHITSLCFNKSGQFCTIGFHKNSYVRVYKVHTLNQIDTWKLLQEMKEHTQSISDIDWANDDKIITTSHDRSTFVWQRKGQHWQKMLVNIDIKLSILCGKWAPSSKKFALGSSCQTIAIGFYNVEAQCWTVATRQKFTKSPITTVSFHPSSNLLALGSSDFSVTIVTCSFKKSENQSIKKLDLQDHNYNGPFKDVDTLFSTILKIENAGGWVNHVSFQKKGNVLLVFPHSNHIKIYELKQSKENIDYKENDIVWKGLPFMNGFIDGNNNLVCGGFDKKIAIFSSNNQDYLFRNYLESNEKSNSVGSKKGFVSNMVTGMIKKATSLAGQIPPQSQHFNTIKVLLVKGSSIVSYDINGYIHFWEK